MTDRIDVAELKTVAFGYNSPLWIGQLLMVMIEGFLILLLIAVYLYARLQFVNWPPAGSRLPEPILPTINLLILLASLHPMHKGDKAVLHCDWYMAQWGAWVSTVLGVVALGIQLYLISQFEVTWYSNIYGSIVWTLLGIHTAHMVAAIIETVVLLVLVRLGFKIDRVRQGLNVDEVYWYFVVLIAVPMYCVLFYVPWFI